MQPTFVEGQPVLVFRLWPKTWIRRGQVIVTKIERTPWMIENNIKIALDGIYIKRVIGISGDEIMTNLKDLPDFFRTKVTELFDQDGKRIWKIPLDYYFIKSDNMGLDSTFTGPVSSKDFMGLVLGKLPSKISERKTNE